MDNDIKKYFKYKIKYLMLKNQLDDGIKNKLNLALTIIDSKYNYIINEMYKHKKEVSGIITLNFNFIYKGPGKGTIVDPEETECFCCWYSHQPTSVLELPKEDIFFTPPSIIDIYYLILGTLLNKYQYSFVVVKEGIYIIKMDDNIKDNVRKELNTLLTSQDPWKLVAEPILDKPGQFSYNFHGEEIQYPYCNRLYNTKISYRFNNFKDALNNYKKQMKELGITIQFYNPKKMLVKYGKEILHTALKKNPINFINLIGPVNVFQTNIDGREFLLLGDHHESIFYKKNNNTITSNHKIIELYNSYYNELNKIDDKFLKKDKLMKNHNKFKAYMKNLKLVDQFNHIDAFKRIIEQYTGNPNKLPPQDNYIFDYIYYLAKNDKFCIDLFLEAEFFNQSKDYLQNIDFLTLTNFLFHLCGKTKASSDIYFDNKNCLKQFQSIRYHQSDTRFYWQYLKVKDTSKFNSHICVNFIEIYIQSLGLAYFNRDLQNMFSKLYEEEDENKWWSKFDIDKIDAFIDEFELIKKQFNKSIFFENLEKFKETYLYLMKVEFNNKDFFSIKQEYSCWENDWDGIPFHIMNFYNLFRMFVRKNGWNSNKNLQNVSTNCKNSNKNQVYYPKYIISYQGAQHISFYKEFIKKYFELQPDQYYEINSQNEKDSDYRYIQIKYKMKDNIILPTFN